MILREGRSKPSALKSEARSAKRLPSGVAVFALEALGLALLCGCRLYTANAAGAALAELQSSAQGDVPC